MTITNIDKLGVPAALAAEVQAYCSELIRAYRGQISSITVIGSAVTTDFSGASSDVNILVVFTELELEDLATVVWPRGSWLRRSRLSPRFISRRNLESAARFFPLDAWMMKEQHVTIVGADLLASIAIERHDLLWQVTHEVKGLRMRLKQQYVRSRGEGEVVRRILSSHFTTLLCLARALLFLRNTPPHAALDQMIAQAANVLCIDAACMADLRNVKEGALRVSRANAARLFIGLLHIVRRLDDMATELSL